MRNHLRPSARGAIRDGHDPAENVYDGRMDLMYKQKPVTTILAGNSTTNVGARVLAVTAVPVATPNGIGAR